MATLVSPGISISVSNESFYLSAGQGSVPLFIVTSQSDKLTSDGTSIATSTQSVNRNKLELFTSQREFLSAYGVPFFNELNGTILQGDELNEVGLQTVYQYLGVANRAYVISPDLNMGQLGFSDATPTGTPPNGTYWLDTTNTVWGVLKANGNSVPGLAWDRKTPLIPTTTQITGGTPVASFGVNGDFAVVTTSNDNKIFEKISNAWYQVGSTTWLSAVPTVALGTVTNPTVILGNVISINGTNVTFTDTSLAQVVTDITNAAISGITASNVSNKLQISFAAGTTLTLANITGTPLTALGLSTSYVGRQVVYNPHTIVPVGTKSGDIWIKTSTPNYGASWIVKLFNSSLNQWQIKAAPLYDGNSSANTGYGTARVVGALYVKYNVTEATPKLGNGTIYRWNGATSTVVTGTVTNPTVTSGHIITINGQDITFSGTTLTSVINDINGAGLDDVLATNVNGKLTITNTAADDITVANDTGTGLTDLGLTAGVNSNWGALTYEAKTTAPTTDPVAGTLWINDDLRADFLVNDGDQWKAYGVAFPTCDPQMVQITSAEPTTQSDDSPLVEGDLWIDSNDTENYPKIRRWNATTSKWVLIDNTDQTTPFGILFADARPNADGTATGSESQADMRTATFLDPDCLNPQNYPSGMLLFNTRYSTYNVKKWNPTKFEGQGAYTVGADSFSAPSYIKRWETYSGNSLDGSPWMGRKAQRKVIVVSMASILAANQDIRSDAIFYNMIMAPGYVELLDEMVTLNVDRKETAFIIADTPPRLQPTGTAIQNWATNASIAASNGEIGKTSAYDYAAMYYPWGLGTDVNGNEVMVPPSTMVARVYAYNDANAQLWYPPAGFRRGQVLNATSVGYLSSENEFVPTIFNEGQRDVLYSNNINPIAFMPNRGLVVYGDKTLSAIPSALDRVNVARLICFIRYQLDALAKPFLFELNIDSTRVAFKETIDRFLSDLVALNALTDFLTIVDNTNNTPTRIDLNQLWADVLLKPTRSIKFIYVPIRILNTGDKFPS